MKFNVEVVHIPGKQLVQAVVATRPITGDRLDVIREAISQDASLQTVAHYIQTDWPAEMSDIPHILHKFYAARAHISEAEEFLLYNDRIIIPHSVQKHVVSQIHNGHQGLTKCRRRTNMSV